MKVFQIYFPTNQCVNFLSDIKSYKCVTDGSTKKLTTLFKKFKPNTVSSQLTFTETINGSEHLPSTVTVIKHGMELLKISLLKRKHKPDASSRLAATGISTDTRERFALLSIFSANVSHITRNLSSVKELLSLFSSRMWSLKVQLYSNYGRKSNLESPTMKQKKKLIPRMEQEKNKEETESRRCREHKKWVHNNKQIISVD